MARKIYRRLTWPVFDEGGNQVHAPGDVFPADAPLDPAARYETFEVDEPDPEPEPPAKAPARQSATVRPEPAAGKGAAHK